MMVAKKEKKLEEVEQFDVPEEILILENTIANKDARIKTLQAEMINYRKRKDEEVINRLKYASEDLILELLPINDNFERAIASNQNKEFERYLEGFKILHNHLKELLEKHGVKEIPALGLEFDPKVHDAIAVIKDESKPDNTVVEVVTKGYSFKEKLIRAAAVQVNKLDKRKDNKENINTERGKNNE